jgi:hypothetical protein
MKMGCHEQWASNSQERREQNAEDAVHRAVVRTRAELEENLGDTHGESNMAGKSLVNR